MQLIFLGAPGSGKGTQAKRLQEEEGYTHISTGDLLRAEVEKGTDLGKKVELIMKSGSLVDDDMVLELLKSNLNFENKNYIFDGFPRNLDQSVSLKDNVIKNRKYKAVYFKIDNQELVSRLANRRLCSNCGSIFNLKTQKPRKEGICDSCGKSALYQRDDDKEEVINKRLKVFDSTIQPMLDYFTKEGTLEVLNANGDSKSIYSQILKVTKG